MFESVYTVLLYIYVIGTIIVLVNGIVENHRENEANKYYSMFMTICTILAVGSFILLVLMYLIGTLGGMLGVK